MYILTQKYYDLSDKQLFNILKNIDDTITMDYSYYKKTYEKNNKKILGSFKDDLICLVNKSKLLEAGLLREFTII